MTRPNERMFSVNSPYERRLSDPRNRPSNQGKFADWALEMTREHITELGRWLDAQQNTERAGGGRE